MELGLIAGLGVVIGVAVCIGAVWLVVSVGSEASVRTDQRTMATTRAELRRLEPGLTNLAIPGLRTGKAQIHGCRLLGNGEVDQPFLERNWSGTDTQVLDGSRAVHTQLLHRGWAVLPDGGREETSSFHTTVGTHSVSARVTPLTSAMIRLSPQDYPAGQRAQLSVSYHVDLTPCTVVSRWFG